MTVPSELWCPIVSYCDAIAHVFRQPRARPHTLRRRPHHQHLPSELWHHILSYCDAAACESARLISHDVRAIVARCAFPRKLSRDASARWFTEPAFQARVAATMARPERDLYVSVEYGTGSNCYPYVIGLYREYEISAAAEVSIRPYDCTTHLGMVPIRLFEPIGHLRLYGCTFYPEYVRNVQYCAAISMYDSIYISSCSFPRQLIECQQYRDRPVSVDALRALATAVTHDFRMTATVWCGYRGRRTVRMQWTNFRRMLLEDATIRLGPSMTVRAGDDCLVFEQSTNSVFDEPESAYTDFIPHN